MRIIPGRYGGYGLRPPRAGSASRMVDPIPEGWKNTLARAEKALAEPFRGSPLMGRLSLGSSRCGRVGYRPSLCGMPLTLSSHRSPQSRRKWPLQSIDSYTGRTCYSSIWSGFTGGRPSPSGTLPELQHTIHLSHVGVECLGRHITMRPGAQALLHTGDVSEASGAMMGGISTRL
jgi:hypothetical protein